MSRLINPAGAGMNAAEEVEVVNVKEVEGAKQVKAEGVSEQNQNLNPSCNHNPLNISPLATAFPAAKLGNFKPDIDHGMPDVGTEITPAQGHLAAERREEVKEKHLLNSPKRDPFLDSPIRVGKKGVNKESQSNGEGGAPMLDFMSITNGTGVVKSAAFQAASSRRDSEMKQEDIYVPEGPPEDNTLPMYRWDNDMDAMKDRWHVLLAIETIMDCPGLLEEWVMLVAALTERDYDIAASARSSAEKALKAKMVGSIAPFRLKLKQQTSGRRAEQQCLEALTSLSIGASAAEGEPFYPAEQGAADAYSSPNQQSAESSFTFPTPHSLTQVLQDARIASKRDSFTKTVEQESTPGASLDVTLEDCQQRTAVSSARRSLTEQLAEVGGPSKSLESTLEDTKQESQKASPFEAVLMEEMSELRSLYRASNINTMLKAGDDEDTNRQESLLSNMGTGGVQGTNQNDVAMASKHLPFVKNIADDGDGDGDDHDYELQVANKKKMQILREVVESPDNFEPDDLVRLLKISKVTANRMIQQAIASQTTTQLFKRGHGKEKTNVIDKKALVASCSPPARKKFATNASCTVRKIASSPEMESAAAAAAYPSLGEVRSEHVMHHFGITKATAKRMTKKDDVVKAVKLDELKERLMKKRESRKQATLGTSANANRVKDASTLFSEEERGAHEAWSASAPQIGLEPELADPEGYLASMAETAVFAKEARENLAEQIAEELAKNAADQVSEPTLESVLARIPVRHGGKEHKSIMKMKAATARLAMALQKRKENAQSDEGLTDEEHALPPLQDAPSSSQPRPTASPRKVFNFLMNHNRVDVPNHGSSDGSRLRKHASKIGSALQKLSPKKLFTRTSSKKQSASAVKPKMIYFLHLHKHGGTSMCAMATSIYRTVMRENCNVPSLYWQTGDIYAHNQI